MSLEVAFSIWDAIKCLGNCTAKHAAVISDLEDNLQSLTIHWTQVKERSEDVKLWVQQAESKPHVGRTREVDGWLQRVNDFQKTIEDIQERGGKVVQDKRMCKFCHKNCLSSHKLGEKVIKTLDHVKGLKVEGDKFDSTNIAHRLPRKPVEEMPIPNTVGMDEMLKTVCDSIEEENDGIIGLYGMGGAGKTTLLKKVYNELATRRHNFALVIWVVVSKDRDIDKIINNICKRVGIDWKDQSRDEKVKEIYNILKQEKFLLLLDDIWERLDLDSIGVPISDETNHSKVVFTTRYENVCDQMQAKKFEVKCLREEEALDLFCMKVGESTINSDPTIRYLAREIIQECKGLPLALMTIGRALAGRTNPQSWEHAIGLLRSFPSEVKGMAEEVFYILKFSFDSLPNDMEKNCFLYLAMFPEDESISIRDLILLWIGEGFLDEHDSIHDAFNHGQDLVESLKLACLVEDHGKNFIKVHDVIRDMALWLFRDQDQNKNRILVQDETLKSLKVDYHIVQRISAMMDSHHGSFQAWNFPPCPHLFTLLVRNFLRINSLANIQFLNQLKVLSLKGIKEITTLPVEIGKLIQLEYLELSQCPIKGKFPIELKNLKSLKVFILRQICSGIEIIPLKVISCLTKLRVFELFVDFELAVIRVSHAEEKLFLEQLELLPDLEDISITLHTPSGFNKLMSSAKLQHCVRYVATAQSQRTKSGRPPIILTIAKLERLEHMNLICLQNSLEVSLVSNIDIFRKLSVVHLYDCHLITHLTWLKCAPHLHTLEVHGCTILEKVIREAGDNQGSQYMDGTFANLETLSLERLPELGSISKRLLPFAKLKHVLIFRCPKIKKLPFDSNSANHLEKLLGEEEWWDNLEWEDPTIKAIFHPKFEVTQGRRLHLRNMRV